MALWESSAERDHREQNLGMRAESRGCLRWIPHSSKEQHPLHSLRQVTSCQQSDYFAQTWDPRGGEPESAATRLRAEEAAVSRHCKAAVQLWLGEVLKGALPERIDLDFERLYFCI